MMVEGALALHVFLLDFMTKIGSHVIAILKIIFELSLPKVKLVAVWVIVGKANTVTEGVSNSFKK